MFCIKCGNQSLDGATFCQKCGAELKSEETVKQKPDVSVPQQTQSSIESDSRATKKNKSLIHWLWLDFAIVAAAFWVFGGDANNEELNVFDYIAIPFSIGAIISAIFAVPKTRKILRIIAILIGLISMILSLVIFA